MKSPDLLLDAQLDSDGNTIRSLLAQKTIPLLLSDVDRAMLYLQNLKENLERLAGIKKFDDVSGTEIK